MRQLNAERQFCVGLGGEEFLAGSSAAGTPRPKPTRMYSRRPREDLLLAEADAEESEHCA
jgi:hypothetical protein